MPGPRRCHVAALQLPQQRRTDGTFDHAQNAVIVTRSDDRVGFPVTGLDASLDDGRSEICRFPGSRSRPELNSGHGWIGEHADDVEGIVVNDDALGGIDRDVETVAGDFDVSRRIRSARIRLAHGH